MNTDNQTARVAGLLYLIVAIFGGFSEVYIRKGFMVAGDAAATANNIMTSEMLFRIGLVADIIMMMSFALLGLVLYRLLKRVNRNAAVLMLLFNLLGVPIMCLNMLSHFAPLLLLSGADYLAVFSTDQLNALSLFALEMHHYGYIIAQISTGTWLLPLGYLVYKSDRLPSIIGILLMVASLGYLADFLAQFLFPLFVPITANILLPVVAIAGEITFIFWLLIKGVKESREVVNVN